MTYYCFYKSSKKRSCCSVITADGPPYIDYSNLLSLGDGKGIERIRQARKEIPKVIHYKAIFTPGLSLIKEINNSVPTAIVM